MSSGSVISEQLFRELLDRDGYSCLHCNNEEGLQPAHYKARSVHPNKEETIDDYILLCNRCHRKHHDAKLIIKNIGGMFFFRELP